MFGSKDLSKLETLEEAKNEVDGELIVIWNEIKNILQEKLKETDFKELIKTSVISKLIVSKIIDDHEWNENSSLGDQS